jgi:hypothetical protein
MRERFIGTHHGHVHPLNINIMAKRGITLSEWAAHFAKGIKAFVAVLPLDLMVPVCARKLRSLPT